MARKHNLQKAADDFGMAAYLAEDGSMIDSGILVTRGIEALNREWNRRRPLREGTPFSDLSLADAITGEIARRKAFRAGQR